MEKLLINWSIRVSLFCLFAFLITETASNRLSLRSPSLAWQRWKTTVWWTGALTSLLHMILAMGWVHQWSHERAFEDTASQTEALLGVRVGWGIYFNYLFVVTWLADATWMLVASSHYRNRNRWIQLGLYGYLVFIAINGAAVFASGWIRWATLALLVGWLGWILRTRNRFLKGTSDHTRTPRNVS